MALIKCPECGKEMSDLAEKCPNCGFPIEFNSNTGIPNNPYQQNLQQVGDYTPKQKNSVLGIFALIFSILGFTFIFGAVLAIIDLIKKDGKKKTCSIIALIICGILLIIIVIASSGNSDSTSYKKNIEQEKQETSVEELNKSAGQVLNDNNKKEETQPISKDDFIASCQEIPYKTLARNPSDYIGAHIVLKVKVSQIIQGGMFDNNQYYRVYTNDEYNMWLGDEYFMYDSRNDDDTKILQGDILNVYAEFNGVETIERALTGAKEDVLSIKAVYIELIEDYEPSGYPEISDADTTAVDEKYPVDDGLTTGQRNALSKAKDYLEFAAFSYTGLIEQLEYAKFSHEEAVYGADNCGADWNEQAALKAKSYLDLMSFSKDGLIEQLEYDGFTHEQAVYGAEQNGY